MKVEPPSQKPYPCRGSEPAFVYSTLTVTSVKGFAYVCVLVSVISQRVFWFPVIVDDEDCANGTAAEAVWALDWLAVVVDVDDEDITDDVVSGDVAVRP